VQIFWQEKFSTISKSCPKLFTNSLHFNTLHFLKNQKVFQNKKVINNSRSLFCKF